MIWPVTAFIFFNKVFYHDPPAELFEAGDLYTETNFAGFVKVHRMIMIYLPERVNSPENHDYTLLTRFTH